jgi:ornithine cyclodeaminase
VASGFYGEIELDLPPYDGLMLVFSQKTARLECILLDECRLTNVRTAPAGAVVADQDIQISKAVYQTLRSGLA